MGEGREKKRGEGRRRERKGEDLGNCLESLQGGPGQSLWIPGCVRVPVATAEAIDSFGWYEILFIKTLGDGCSQGQ